MFYLCLYVCLYAYLSFNTITLKKKTTEKNYENLCNGWT